MIYLELYIMFFKVGLFSFGGGYSAVPIIISEVVDGANLITLQEFADILTISEMTPGPIAVNCATFVGTKTAGIFGSICASLGFMSPSLIICIILAYFFYKYKNLKVVSQVLSYLKPVVVGVIGSVAVTLFYTNVMGSSLSIDIRSLSIFLISAYLIVKKKQQIYTVMPIAAIMGIVLYM